MDSFAPQAIPATAASEVFQLMRDGQARTKAEIAELTSSARSTVSARLDLLLSAGLLVPVGEAASTGGRPPVRFALNAASYVVLAVDLGASHAAVAVVDLGGEVLGEVSVASDITEGPQIVLDRVADLARRLLADLDLTPDAVVGIGVGVPGPVEHSTGRPANPPIMPGWHDFDIPGALGRTFPVPVRVDNDVNVMALGEHTTRWPETGDLLYVKVATGIGSGIISNRLLVRGALGTAGDLGHVQVSGQGDDVACRCGNLGCLEAVAAGPAIAKRLIAEGLSIESPQDVVRAVERGEVEAVRAVRDAGRAIGSVLATCVSLLNPSVVVVGGSMSATGEYLLAGIREVVYQRSLPLATHQLRIVSSPLHGREALVGAAVMVLDEVLSPRSVDALIERRTRASA
ncbi:ROK family protein [Mumia zhuanghuii]|uniref:ROK family protein n=1 Tax=Mumia zhuanghuii TaxID=2585211 RepID=A0A5C4MRF5_9ACTN|nr:ROK family protein [Mumia zhuanghuii]TNC47528.1 ROK family protein [Mumia zhuanghuii]TNC50298.1 ROK family protein [Mumia zhuanghuii]